MTILIETIRSYEKLILNNEFNLFVLKFTNRSDSIVVNTIHLRNMSEFLTFIIEILYYYLK